MSSRTKSALSDVTKQRFSQAQKSLNELQKEIAPFAPTKGREARTSAGPWIEESFAHRGAAYRCGEGQLPRK